MRLHDTIADWDTTKLVRFIQDYQDQIINPKFKTLTVDNLIVGVSLSMPTDKVHIDAITPPFGIASGETVVWDGTGWVRSTVTKVGNTSLAGYPWVNADISASAAIAYSKLNLTGAVLNADLAGSIAYSKLALTGSILNADLAGSIAYSKLVLTGAVLNADLAGSIAYSKLSLTGAILNTDLAGSIAYSKLVLTGSITNTDLAGSIAYSKLVLTGSVVNADVASGAAIAYSKLALTGSILNADLAGSIAYSKLALTGAILNADLAGSIAYSKLVLTGSVVNADIATGAAIAYSKLALTGAILNADLAGSIAYSKLSLTGAILNADLAGSIAYSKLVLTGAILNADLAGGIAYSKLILSNSIVNADIASAAAIAISKLAGYPSDVTLFLSGSGTWITPFAAASYTAVGSFTNSWGNKDNTTYNAAGYWKDNEGIIHLRGVISGGTVQTSAFTLPAGYRPAKKSVHLQPSDFTVGRVDIASTGTVTPQSRLNNLISLDGILFATT